MAKAKPTPEHQEFCERISASLSDRLQRMQKRFQGVAEGAVVINNASELNSLARQVSEMVAEARALEERPAADTPIENAAAVQAAMLLYHARDDLDAVRHTLTATQRALVEKHREGNVDPDGALGGGIDAAIAKLQRVRLLVASGSEVRS